MRILVVLALTAALVWAGFRLFGNEVKQVRGAQIQEPVVQLESVKPPAPVPPAPVVEPSNPFENQTPVLGVDQRAWNELAADLAHANFVGVRARLDARSPALPDGRAEVLRSLVQALSGQSDQASELAAKLFERGTLSPRDVAILQAALGHGAPPTAGQHLDALDLASELAVVLRTAERESARGQVQPAAVLLTRLFTAELSAPWETKPRDLDVWVGLLRDVHRRFRWDPRVEWPHFEVTVEPGDGLTTIRQRAISERPGLALSTGLIARSNRLGEGVIHAGQVLHIPTDPVTVLVDVSKKWLIYRIGNDVVEAWPVGTGADGKETLIGEFVVGLKQTNPTWWPRNRPGIPFGHPDNPLGTRWLGWRESGATADTSFGFHGTWLPETIGQAASEGCVRLRNEDVEVLYEILPQGAAFTVRP